MAQSGFDEQPFLVVEDSVNDLFMLQKALHEAAIPNPHVTAPSGRHAIDYLEASAEEQDPNNPFPVIMFLDLLMPGFDGFDVLNWLNEHPHPPLPIVLHTGVEDESLLQRARDLGATFFLPKGASADSIQEVFRRAREQWRQSHTYVH